MCKKCQKCRQEGISCVGLRYVGRSCDGEKSQCRDRKSVGAEVDLEVGGHIDTREPGPLAVHATVEALADDPMGGHTALLRTGGLRFIITTNRNQYTMYSQFELLGVDITTADVVVVKIGYLEPDLYETQKGWLMALTPGGVDQDLIRLGHHKIERPMFPFDPDMADPDLHAQVVLP